MSTGVSKSTANESSSTIDRRISTGAGTLLATEGSSISVQSLDADLIGKIAGLSTDTVTAALDGMGDTTFEALARMQKTASDAGYAITDTASQAMELASDTNKGTFAFASQAMELASDTNKGTFAFASQTNDNVFDLGAQLIRANQDISNSSMDLLGQQSQSFNTTLRDTLSAVFNNDNLAGSAEQSGGAAGWVSRNPIIAAMIGFGGLFALIFYTTRKK